MLHREFTAAGIGGIDLYAQAWLPGVAPRAVIVVSHGLAEHGGRYETLAGELVQRGYAVYAVDHRGHGRSSGPRANIERFAHVVADFCAFTERCAGEHPATPVFMLGHSMGGAVAFASALRLQHMLRGLVLSAPALATDQPVPRLQEMFVRLLSVVAPGTGALALPPGAVSRDPSVVARYAADPLVHHEAIPARTLVELLGAMQGFPASAPGLRLPTLVLHGTADQLVPLAANRRVYQAFGTRDCVVKLYDGLYHEVFNEPERERVTADLFCWLER
ncbi:MAG: lysophospholipase [Steroidobacteraceae bacterium]|jgi:alpha-beta hydrolase superfamily lysophospholipase|nr:alpha/beta hydrolase [Pseudomonadota bacterium]MBP7608246.1 lysophospholipase [Steroidobacteraceae bacterium]MBP9129125.1 lysophospholipase [Steroidobacteraceae bacterium]